ncbi:S16 family serine protease [Alkalihalobacillus sp. LMS39]|uniref:S16 family serine protease n=1 Tax=Alkalihalobacillus sp. LMS39 TaxID=2924032 RepID=UPI001FB53B57|nr:S16 family serine protease [Alkalihalobacillus sp. LMS39]UOE92023.1 hypothetical protein MM271_12160 [Alkalihalobacillus sp. LMS39]
MIIFLAILFIVFEILLIISGSFLFFLTTGYVNYFIVFIAIILLSYPLYVHYLPRRLQIGFLEYLVFFPVLIVMLWAGSEEQMYKNNHAKLSFFDDEMAKYVDEDKRLLSVSTLSTFGKIDDLYELASDLEVIENDGTQLTLVSKRSYLYAKIDYSYQDIVASFKLDPFSKSGENLIMYFGEDIKEYPFYQDFMERDAYGDSGGLALATAIMQERNMIHVSREIAITGAVDEHGYVHPVGGLVQKIPQAAFYEAEIFLCPAENLEFALFLKKHFDLSIEIVGISHIDELLELDFNKLHNEQPKFMK